MRGKLIELINHAKEMRETDAMDIVRESECDIFDKLAELMSEAEYISDHLIANGVVVQEWIPVSERLPDDGEKILLIDSDDVYLGVYEKQNGVLVCHWHVNGITYPIDDFTHWMPIPAPPKGE